MPLALDSWDWENKDFNLCGVVWCRDRHVSVRRALNFDQCRSYCKIGVFHFLKHYLWIERFDIVHLGRHDMHALQLEHGSNFLKLIFILKPVHFPVSICIFFFSSNEATYNSDDVNNNNVDDAIKFQNWILQRFTSFDRSIKSYIISWNRFLMIED